MSRFFDILPEKKNSLKSNITGKVNSLSHQRQTAFFIIIINLRKSR